MHTLSVLRQTLAVCRLDPEAPTPGWAGEAGWFSITRTADELSVVAPEDRVPEGVRAERGWRALRVAGPLDFSLTGVLSSLAGPLADAGVSVFALSTFDTDYLLVRERQLELAVTTLTRAGHTVRSGED